MLLVLLSIFENDLPFFDLSEGRFELRSIVQYFIFLSSPFAIILEDSSSDLLCQRASSHSLSRNSLIQLLVLMVVLSYCDLLGIEL